MLYFDFEAGNKAYKLRLNTRNVINLEKQLNCNPVAIFGMGDTIPTVSAMVAILHQSLQQYQHGVTVDDAYRIFDDYLADGNTVTDFISVIIEIYKVSGILKNSTDDTEDTEKN